MAASNRTFDEIMDDIASGLTGERENDYPYLQEQMQTYRDHELSEEILRACGRLIYQMTPEDLRRELYQKVSNRHDATEATLDEAAYSIKTGNWRGPSSSRRGSGRAAARSPAS